ncbi:Hypothetical protein PENO1_101720 [Penicillium occitanis (nom. inval.)]|nr:Hypothetical protein PENO1_101720 [Penicillium occitanis (nom. inval.)]PCG90487.1 hypothetical protein PENOC_101780 [Penicillium occitanis (nom. inval.)]
MPLTPGDIAHEEAHINQDISYQLIVTEVIFSIVALAGVSIRVWVKLTKAQRPFGFDDVLVLGGFLLAIGLVIASCMTTKYGVGKHIIAVSASDLTSLSKLNFVVEILYPGSIAMAKLSMVVLFSRTLAVDRGSKIFLWGLGVWIFFWAVGTYLDVFLECRPLHSIWTAECAPSFATSLSTGVLNVLSDFAILAYPQPILWNLQMPMRRRIGLITIFLSGLFGTAISLARIPILKASNIGGNPDLTYHLIPTYIFTVVEPLIAVSCACAPFYLHVGRAIGAVGSSFRSLFTSTYRSGFVKTGDAENLSAISITASSQRELQVRNNQAIEYSMSDFDHGDTIDQVGATFTPSGIYHKQKVIV